MSGNEYFELPPFTSTVTGCQTFSYGIFDDNLATSVPASLSLDLVSGFPNVRAVASNGALIQSYSFFIRVTEAGGAIKWTAQCTLNV
jgi:hypothetical protein